MKKKNKLKFCFMLPAVLILVHSSISVRAMSNDTDDLSAMSPKGPTHTESASRPLDRFFKESNEKRGITIRTPRTVITPLTTLVFDDLEEMFRNKDTDFIPNSNDFALGTPEGYQYYVKLRAFENMSLDDKRSITIYDYCVFIEDETAEHNVVFAGLYSISSPDGEGWSESRFILGKEHRGKGLGEEVKKAIYDRIIKGSISIHVKLIKYRIDPDHPEALFIRHRDIPDNIIPNVRNAKAYTENATVPFKGLQGWVHEDNKASIRLNEKCGWINIDSKEDIDLKREKKKFYLYRSPPQ